MSPSASASTDPFGPFDPGSFRVALRSALRTARASRLGRPFRLLEEVGSTQDEALEWASEGAPEGATVVALSQTRGRGRNGRSWVSPPGGGLWFSVILRPQLGYPECGLLPVAVGAGVALALATLDLPVRLKWPNDILIRGRKVGGVLVESRMSGRRCELAVAGVGINWTPPPLEEALHPITGLGPEVAARTPGAPPPSPAAVLASVLSGIELSYLVLKAAGSVPFLSLWPRLSAHFLRPALVYGPDGAGGGAGAGERREVITGDLLPDGRLRALGADGHWVELAADEVRLSLPWS